MANNTSTTTETRSSGFLGAVERLGNKIPHPVYLFICLWVIALAASCILGTMGVMPLSTPQTERPSPLSYMMTSAAWADFLKDMGKNLDDICSYALLFRSVLSVWPSLPTAAC